MKLKNINQLINRQLKLVALVVVSLLWIMPIFGMTLADYLTQEKAFKLAEKSSDEAGKIAALAKILKGFEDDTGLNALIIRTIGNKFLAQGEIKTDPSETKRNLIAALRSRVLVAPMISEEPAIREGSGPGPIMPDSASVGGDGTSTGEPETDGASVASAVSDAGSAEASIEMSKKPKKELTAKGRKLQSLYRKFDQYFADEKVRKSVIEAEDALLTELGRKAYRAELFGILEDERVLATDERNLDEINMAKVLSSPHLQRVYQMLSNTNRTKIARNKLDAEAKAKANAVEIIKK